MSYFLHDYLDVFSPHAVPTLVSSGCMRTIARAAQPLRTVDGGGFECRLGDESTHADFAVRLARRDLESLPRLDEVPAQQRGIWARIHGLARAWRQPGSTIGASATKLWLEYDIPAESDPEPAPSVFVGLGKEPEAARACAAASLDALLDEDRRERAKAWVARCFDALPACARVAFVGVLLPRPRALVNLNIIALANDGIAPLLAALDWLGDPAQIAALTAELGEHCDRLALSLSFDPTSGECGEIVGRIGLECFIDQPEPLPAWRSMLDHFVDTGLCTADKREATLAWAGVCVVDPRAADESNLAKVLALLGGQVVGAFTRRINHLKVSYTPGRGPDLKAYFDFGHVIARRERAPGRERPADYIESVRDYYDRFARSIVDTVGTTYQAGMLTGPNPTRSYAASNLDLARRAGITQGMTVLDAGCGSCGPAVDIAGTIPRLSIDAITISREQAKLGRAHVQANGLSPRIRVHVGDYHDLPFHDRSFDVALFFETLGYAYDLGRLFAGVHRVLRPDGRIYIKDTFVHEGPVSEQARRALAEHDARYVYRTPKLTTIVDALEAAGFEIEWATPLGRISTQVYDDALAQPGDGAEATAFAAHHRCEIAAPLPIYFGEIRARK